MLILWELTKKKNLILEVAILIPFEIYKLYYDHGWSIFYLQSVKSSHDFSHTTAYHHVKLVMAMYSAKRVTGNASEQSEFSHCYHLKSTTTI